MARKSLFSAIIAFVVVGNFADAADLKPAYKAPVAAPVVLYNWTGLYAGGHLGGAWADADWITDVSLTTPPYELVNPQLNSWLGGAQLGYRWQIGSWVAGVEGTLSWTSLDKFQIAPNLSAAAFPNRWRGTDIDRVFTVTGQLGYAWSSWLVYAKAGWAGGANVTLKHDNQNTPTGSKATWNGDASGWTVGAGVEWGLTPNWSFGVEYNYLNLTTDNLQSVTTAGTPVNVLSFDADIHSVVARMNYRFDWGKSPVTAKF